MLVARPSFTVIAVIALALGIGANSSIFSVVNGVLLKPLPYKESDKLVKVWESWAGFDNGAVSYPNFLDWRQRNKSFEKMAAYRWIGFNITGGDQPERVEGRRVSADFLSILGVNPELGRDFTAADDNQGANPVTIISDSLWKRRFGADPSIIGKTIMMDDQGYEVIGVLPPDFHFFGNYVSVNALVAIQAKEGDWLHQRAWHPGIQVIARVKPGVSLAQARAEMSSIAGALAQEYPDTNKGHGISVRSLYEATVGDYRKLLLLLAGAVGFVLLIACANVANLMLARASARQKEIAIRSALGASRVRIIRLLIVESVLLSLIGGTLGVVIAYWGTGVALALPNALPRINDIKIDGSVLLFTLAASLMTGIGFGLAPALQASKPDLNGTLKEGGRSGTVGRQGIRSVLVVSEIAISLILLVGAGLLIRSFISLNQVNTGFDEKNLLTFDTSLSSKQFSDATKIRNFYREFIEKIRAIPGVRDAARTDLLPLLGGDSELQFYVNGRPKPSLSELPIAMAYLPDNGYLKTMGIPLLRGRFFDSTDTKNSGTVSVIDENLGNEYFPGEDPIGQHITIQAGPSFAIDTQIIGIVRHVKQQNLDTADGSNVGPQLYLSFEQIPDGFLSPGSMVVVRTESDPLSYVPAMRSALNSLSKTATLSNPKTMETVKADVISDRRFTMILVGVFSALALVLASIGIYGVISYSVAQRTREIGIRMALGASRGQVLCMVLGGGAKLAIIGIAIGALGAMILTQLIKSFLFGVSPSDPLTFVVIAFVLSCVTLLASYVPARRAMKVDPNSALRYE